MHISVLDIAPCYRPILDLRELNTYVYKRSFKMSTCAQVASSITRGCWLISLDLKVGGCDTVWLGCSHDFVCLCLVVTTLLPFC